MYRRKITLILLFFILMASSNLFAQSRSDFTDQRGRYLIITHDIFYQAVTPLAEWKHQKGMEVEVAKISQIGSTLSQIKTYIQDAYNNWEVPPEYVLLVGDSQYIPTDAGSDNAYGNMEGDIKAEIVVGRFSVYTTTEAETMVAKTIGYEKAYDVETNPDWMLSAIGIIREDASGNQIYYDDIEYISTLMWENNYTTIDEFRKNWGNNQDDVEASINQGRAFITYRGSSSINWYAPFTVEMNDLNNGFMLPIVMSATCYTGDFSGTGADCELWTRAGTPENPKGAVAYFATYTHGVGSFLSNMRSTMTRSFYDAIFSEGKTQLGEACVWSKDNLLQSYPSQQSEYKGWNLLGDPELNIWMENPKNLSVNHLPVAPLGEFDYIVTVTDDNNEPIEDVRVCLSKNNDVYEIEYTNEEGIATLTTDIAILGEMKLTVSGNDYIPYQADVLVVEELSAIEGEVRNSENNNLLEYAKVTIESINQFDHTGGDGFYRIYLPGAGDYQLNAELFGFYDYESETITVTMGDTIQHDIYLDPKPSGVLEGYVTTESGDPVSFANVKPVGVAVSSVYTNSTGHYIFPDIPGDYDYQIKVDHSQYEPKTKSIYVPVNESRVLDFELPFLITFETQNGDFEEEPEWEWGVPIPAGGPEEAYSGQKVWGTDLNSYYNPSTNQNLYTPEYYLPTGKDEYRLIFRHWYETEDGWDGGNVQISTDSGENWNTIDPIGNYPDNSIVALGGQAGFTGEMLEWNEVEFDLSDYIGETVKFKFRFASTNTSDKRGWFIDNFSVHGTSTPPSVVEEETEITSAPQSYQLNQNYPNPFNPTTTIEYRIPTEGAHKPFTIKIYDAAGKLIKSLVDDKKEAGYHKVIWNGKDDAGKSVSSGIYYYKMSIENENFNKTRRMVLLK